MQFGTLLNFYIFKIYSNVPGKSGQLPSLIFYRLISTREVRRNGNTDNIAEYLADKENRRRGNRSGGARLTSGRPLATQNRLEFGAVNRNVQHIVEARQPDPPFIYGRKLLAHRHQQHPGEHTTVLRAGELRRLSRGHTEDLSRERLENQILRAVREHREPGAVVQLRPDVGPVARRPDPSVGGQIGLAHV